MACESYRERCFVCVVSAESFLDCEIYRKLVESLLVDSASNECGRAEGKKHLPNAVAVEID